MPSLCFKGVALIWACRCVRPHPTISHGFLGPTDVPQARAVAPIDAPAVAALPADAQEQAACKHVPAAAAEPACSFAAADCAAVLSVAAYLPYSNAFPVRASADDHVSD